MFSLRQVPWAVACATRQFTELLATSIDSTVLASVGSAFYELVSRTVNSFIYLNCFAQ